MAEVHDAPASGGSARRPTPQHLDTDALTAYLDGGLEADARPTAAAHLAGCPDCRRELAELRTTVALLHGLPQYRPRRSFQLGPAYARSVHASRFARFLPLLPALRTATACVALLLAVVTAADIWVDAEDGQESSPERVVLDDGNSAPPADARQPTGRDPLPADDAGVDQVAGGAAPEQGGKPAAPPSADQPAEEAAGPQGEPADAAGQAAADNASTSGDQTADQPAASPADDGSDGLAGLSAWQLAQVGLGLVLAGCLAALILLQRLIGRARRLDPGF